MTKTAWDYSALAAFYDNRADYSEQAIDTLIAEMGLTAGNEVADIGAGTGKLAAPLGQRRLNVSAVEPNDDMRKFGIRNTQGLPVRWYDGTGEKTGLADSAFDAVFFGSSFNVVDQVATLHECRRLVRPKGWFCCMWNHRDLDDPLQARIESTIRSFIPAYDYGLRRADPSAVLEQSGYFGEIRSLQSGFVTDMAKSVIMDAWRSHGTLARQAGADFDRVIAAIDQLIEGGTVPVPYTTRVWYARFRD